MRISILALIALVAAVAGWIAAPLGGGSPTAGRVESPLGSGASGRIVEPAPVGRDEPGTLPTAPVDAVPVHAPPPDELAALLARLPALAVPTGAGAIVGTVVRDDDGTPLPGIAIDAIIDGAPPGAESKGIDSPDLESFIREEIEQYRYDAAMARRAVTDADGRFRLEGLSPGAEYSLHPVPNEEWILFSRDRTWELSSGAEVKFRAARFATVVVRAFDAGGEPIVAGTVWMRPSQERDDPLLWAEFSAESAEIRVPVPFTRLLASTGRGWTSSTVEVLLAAGERREVLFVEERPPFLAVTILAPDPIDRIGVELIAEPLDGAPLHGEPDRVIDDARVRHERVDSATGRASIDLEPGSYRLRVLRDDIVLAERSIVAAAVGEELAIPIPPRPSAEVATIRLVGPDGEPCSTNYLRLIASGSRDRESEGEREISIESFDLGAGRNAIIVKEPLSPLGEEGLPPPELHICVDTEYSGAARFPFQVGAPGEQIFRIPQPARLEVRILDYVGHELQDRIELVMDDPHSDLDSMEPLSIDPVGTAIIDRSLVGRKSLLIRLEGSWLWSNRVLDEREISVEPGENLLDITLPQVHSLRVRCSPAAAGERLTLEALSVRWNLDESIPEDGIVEFDDLVAGSYRLRAGQGGAAVPVEIPRDADIRFGPDPPNALRVMLLAPRPGQGPGWLERAGLRQGDRIIGVARSAGAAAEEIRSVRALHVAVLRAIARGMGELILERPEGEIRVPIPAGDPPGIQDLGGDFEPAIRRGAP